MAEKQQGVHSLIHQQKAERSGGGGAHTGNGTSYLKPQTLAPVTHLLPQGHTSKSFPTSSTEQGPSIQIYILLRAFLIQTTTVLSYQTPIKKMHHGLAHRSIWWGYFFPGSFFPNASSSWHVDTTAQWHRPFL